MKTSRSPWFVRRRGTVRVVVTVLFSAVGVVASAVPAQAADGSIDHVQSDGASMQVLYSLPGLGADTSADLDSLAVSLNDRPVDASARLAADEPTVKRTAVLAIDVSKSMRRNGKFEAAKQAAQVFLDSTPDDLYIGIVTFAGDVQVAQKPTLDRDVLRDVVDGLTMAVGTRLYDGVKQAVQVAGAEGPRSILVLSDGHDSTDTPLQTATGAVDAAKVKLDVVALDQSEADQSLLKPLSDAGNGSVISAEDPASLSAVFASEAEALAKQVLITLEAPDDLLGDEGTLSVTLNAGGEVYSDSAFVTFGVAGSTEGPAAAPTKLQPADQGLLKISPNMMLGGLVAAGLGFLVLVLAATGLLSRGKGDTVEDRIAAYTRKGSRKLTKGPQPAPQGMTAQAVGMAERALESNRGLEAAVGQRLEAAGMSLKPAEWLLAHAGIAAGAGVVGLLVGSGSIVFALVGVLLGAAVPWFFLGFKKSRRTKAFKAQMADTLQLMSGSLSAGLSLAQSVDTVVREGADPMSAEFRRAIVETRLGVEIEDALEGVSERMKSIDFHWVVMAIRIQREVGGNLAELLNTVAGTIREREYLERQVLALSAEGRLSVWILGGLPPGFMAYLMVANRAYLQPLISSMMGYILIGVMAVLLTGGILWMKKLVKVDV